MAKLSSRLWCSLDQSPASQPGTSSSSPGDSSSPPLHSRQTPRPHPPAAHFQVRRQVCLYHIEPIFLLSIQVSVSNAKTHCLHADPSVRSSPPNQCQPAHGKTDDQSQKTQKPAKGVAPSPSQRQITASCSPEVTEGSVSSRPPVSPPSAQPRQRETKGDRHAGGEACMLKQPQQHPSRGGHPGQQQPVHGHASSNSVKLGGRDHMARPASMYTASPHQRCKSSSSLAGQGRHRDSTQQARPPPYQQPLLTAGPGSWAHMLAHPEKGCLLLSNGSPDLAAFDRTIILVTSHGRMCPSTSSSHIKGLIDHSFFSYYASLCR